jgi:SAM-dependent methyltransferase
VTVFGSEYAGAYDALYQDKDYAAECDLVERVFRDYAHAPIRRVLDLGCGTGRHTELLAARGYDVVGVDRSAEMLGFAKAGVHAQFVESDITSLHLGENFDAVLIMFAVLGYLRDNTSLQAALNVARGHLRPGGLLFADVWYGPAVLTQRPSERVKVIDAPNGDRVIRATSAQLDVRRNLCTVDYYLWRLHAGTLCAEVREQHVMRYFFEPELERFLASAGFEVQHFGAFPDFDDEPGEHSWNIAVVARAR